MTSAIYTGTIAHKRYIPKVHAFKYPFFMWYLDLDEMADLPSLGRWFSTNRWALSMFSRADYLGSPDQALGEVVRERMTALTGHPVTGKVFGLINMRSLGLFFSPVNFYYGFNQAGEMSHLLAEVSNTPWNERHHYAHYVANGRQMPTHPKAFHVSPFNKKNQSYHWKIASPGETIAIDLGVHDHRGHIFQARLRLNRQPLSKPVVRRQLLKRPVLTAYIIGGIYWQAMKLFFKGVPYVPYQKEGS